MLCSMDSSERYSWWISNFQAQLSTDIHHQWTMWISTTTYVSPPDACKSDTLRKLKNSWCNKKEGWVSLWWLSLVASLSQQAHQQGSLPQDQWYGLYQMTRVTEPLSSSSSGSSLSDCLPPLFASISIFHIGVIIFSQPWSACSFSKEIWSTMCHVSWHTVSKWIIWLFNVQPLRHWYSLSEKAA